MDRFIAHMKTPLISFMDGVISALNPRGKSAHAENPDDVVGGGVGLSVHAPFRIATEKTVFAMPEVSLQFTMIISVAERRHRQTSVYSLMLEQTSSCQDLTDSLDYTSA